MSESQSSASVRFPIFWAVVFALMFLSGNCSMCGGDVNYIQQWAQP